ncbi:cytochrome c maturation protein CcmE [Nitratireductor sp. ZSWI3]|uniref:cytochrome c maturation protein CcmE n=1 Tax=Nitratireductor sp. ZSWI3 TaxID=2966359 RepID=UPI0021505AC3|nr:cytochrome c maturation protein CcmE [Nitratireductor sp. ZSWI3]MCR4268379.1 cytochrome c maturation protein CcmE [Nitratireductor sp. ZSWI3]
MTRKQKRLAIIGGAVGFLAVATGLTLYALRQQTSYFYMPGDLEERPVAAGQRIRLGGLVEKGSILRGDDTHVRFAVTDGATSVMVTYSGILPDLFREEQGVVTEGSFNADHVFVADSVLAKHDENYMPKEVANSLKEKGVWQEN